MPSDLLQIGVVTRPHALRGQLRVRLHNEDSGALERVSTVWLEREQAGAAASGGTSKAWKVEAAQALPDGCYLLTLAGIADRTAAEALQGTRVLVRRDELAALEDGEVYLADLQGLLVKTIGGDELGRVSQILDLNGNTLLCVAGVNQAEILLPAIPQVMLSVDFSAGVVIVEPPDGLLGV